MKNRVTHVWERIQAQHDDEGFGPAIKKPKTKIVAEKPKKGRVKVKSKGR